MKIPELKIGDTILIGKWKNRKAIIKGFGKDKNNQPIIKTTLGDVSMFRFRVKKLMKEEIQLALLSKGYSKEMVFSKLIESYIEEFGPSTISATRKTLASLIKRKALLLKQMYPGLPKIQAQILKQYESGLVSSWGQSALQKA